ncbi:glycoside hydrolase family 2 TIM barrel-domain containing protein [uncultured Polaribacter sp.]|uniref:glycoside hydrolase family 2 TIM barrel-domain containing protein n=1 Tax=uncultured Polaribacter sp. TaxID=174711 RepID=UPI0026348FA7|nr:glycoside hydrolase family 2 TIM barrel-domain containing protein [uncultured Polaribacter sp.]
MKIIYFNFLLIILTFSVSAQTNQVSIVNNELGFKLQVDDKDFIINGMNWDYIPIGKNPLDANFWENSDEIIKEALKSEMILLKNMGVNTLRLYTGVPAKWIQYIYENYGIYTMLNHPFGRYGLSIDGVWIPVTDYSNPKAQKQLLSEIESLIKAYKNTPGLLMYLLGNENNYGLFWAGSETEDFPDDEKEKQRLGEIRGRPMYRLMNEAAKKIKKMDENHPVAICNGDTLFIDIIAQECKDVDVFGTNTYRGVSFTGIFNEVKQKLNKPLLFTEFGADAFNAKSNKEDQCSQAYYLIANWKEIYQNTYGKEKAQNSIGGFTFQFNDGWWKYDFDHRRNVNIHDKTPNWANQGYNKDWVSGKNNMNEEWFGICAKGPTNSKGLFTSYPRAAYYALQEVHQLNPYDHKVDLKVINKHFKKISIKKANNKAKVDTAILEKILKKKK